jgi:hypothetical protein
MGLFENLCGKSPKGAWTARRDCLEFPPPAALTVPNGAICYFVHKRWSGMCMEVKGLPSGNAMRSRAGVLRYYHHSASAAADDAATASLSVSSTRESLRSLTTLSEILLVSSLTTDATGACSMLECRCQGQGISYAVRAFLLGVALTRN